MKRRCPQSFTADEIRQWVIEEQRSDGVYVLSRPCGFSGWKFFLTRLKMSIDVFLGRSDVLTWNGNGTDGSRQRDCLDPNFGSDNKRIYF